MRAFLFVSITLCQLCIQCQSADNDVEGDTGNLPPLTAYYTGQCILCPSGSPGPRGSPGAEGIPGRDGRDGRDGHGGGSCNGGSNIGNNDGDDTSEPGTNAPPQNTDAFGGAVYIRWGRTECSSASELVYSGVAAGGYYNHAGSGANYLCMPEDPIYDEPHGGTGGDRALIYGAEYQTSTYPQWSDLHDSNVPCAVCWAPSRPSLLVIPARNVCPGSGWTIEYAGYMAASYYDHLGRSEFVCMDRNPVGVPRSSHNANGALFFVAEGRCGSGGSGLPCGPYVNGNEITCAVCTR